MQEQHQQLVKEDRISPKCAKAAQSIKHHGSAKGLKPVPTSGLSTQTPKARHLPKNPYMFRSHSGPRYPLTCSSPRSRWSSTQIMMGLSLDQGKVHSTQVRMGAHLVIVATQHRHHICSHPRNRSHPAAKTLTVFPELDMYLDVSLPSWLCRGHLKRTCLPASGSALHP